MLHVHDIVELLLRCLSRLCQRCMLLGVILSLKRVSNMSLNNIRMLASHYRDCYTFNVPTSERHTCSESRKEDYICVWISAIIQGIIYFRRESCVNVYMTKIWIAIFHCKLFCKILFTTYSNNYYCMRLLISCRKKINKGNFVKGADLFAWLISFKDIKNELCLCRLKSSLLKREIRNNILQAEMWRRVSENLRIILNYSRGWWKTSVHVFQKANCTM